MWRSSWRSCFNPLPSPKRGEMHREYLGRDGYRRFNPLPSPKRGEISQDEKLGKTAWFLCFNPLPSPKRGEIRIEGSPLSGLPKSFNPLPSPKRGEISLEVIRLTAYLPFQSAPLTEARGDMTGIFRARGPNRVSIRSPHRSEGRSGEVADSVPEALVSIRSPHRSEGRSLAINSVAFAPVLFQSAPLTEARGDLCGEEGYT